MTVQPLLSPRTRAARPHRAPRADAPSGDRPPVRPPAPAPDPAARRAAAARDAAFEALLAALPLTPRVEVDVPGRRVLVDGATVPLTRQELDLLVHLARSAGRVVTRDELHAAAWRGRPLPDGTRTVDVHVRRLRAKTGLADLVTTVRGVGYRLEPSEGLTLTDVPA